MAENKEESIQFKSYRFRNRLYMVEHLLTYSDNYSYNFIESKFTEYLKHTYDKELEIYHEDVRTFLLDFIPLFEECLLESPKLLTQYLQNQYTQKNQQYIKEFYIFVKLQIKKYTPQKSTPKKYTTLERYLEYIKRYFDKIPINKEYAKFSITNYRTEFEEILGEYDHYLERVVDFRNKELEHEDAVENDYFSSTIKNYSEPIYNAFMAALKDNLIIQKNDKYDFQCSDYSTVACFFKENDSTKRTDWKLIHHFITMRGQELPKPSNLKSKAHYPTREFEEIQLKYFMK